MSYVYRYRNNVRGENSGYIKGKLLHGKDMVLRIWLNVIKNKTCKCKVFLLYKAENTNVPRGKYITDIDDSFRDGDTLVKQINVLCEDALLDGKTFYCYDGLLFLCESGEIFIGLWNEYRIIVDDILIDVKDGNSNEAVEEEKFFEDENEEVNKEENKGENAEVNNYKDETENENICTEEINYSSNLAGEIIASYPKLPIFFDSPFGTCVKIIPQDIGKLDMRNWKLASNSFLVHGYYNYRYLMLGKVKRDDKIVLGVPGVFTNKEKYMANMFGFKTFIPVKKTDVLTGSFGYWVVSVFNE